MSESYQVIITPEARDGIRRAYEWIAEYSPDSAIAKKGKVYRILFIVRDAEVYVLFVRHSSQKPLLPDE